MLELSVTEVCHINLQYLSIGQNFEDEFWKKFFFQFCSFLGVFIAFSYENEGRKGGRKQGAHRILGYLEFAQP